MPSLSQPTTLLHTPSIPVEQSSRYKDRGRSIEAEKDTATETRIREEESRVVSSPLTWDCSAMSQSQPLLSQSQHSSQSTATERVNETQFWNFTQSQSQSQSQAQPVPHSQLEPDSQQQQSHSQSSSSSSAIPLHSTYNPYFNLDDYLESIKPQYASSSNGQTRVSHPRIHIDIDNDVTSLRNNQDTTVKNGNGNGNGNSSDSEMNEVQSGGSSTDPSSQQNPISSTSSSSQPPPLTYLLSRLIQSSSSYLYPIHQNDPNQQSSRDLTSATFYSFLALQLFPTSIEARRLHAICTLNGGQVFPFSSTTTSQNSNGGDLNNGDNRISSAQSAIHILESGPNDCFKDKGVALVYSQACEILGRFGDSKEAFQFASSSSSNHGTEIGIGIKPLVGPIHPIPFNSTVSIGDRNKGIDRVRLANLLRNGNQLKEAEKIFKEVRELDGWNWSAWLGENGEQSVR